MQIQDHSVKHHQHHSLGVENDCEGFTAASCLWESSSCAEIKPHLVLKSNSSQTLVKPLRSLGVDDDSEGFTTASCQLPLSKLILC
jgi:hypothetical protein